jgi:hypothetical protein
VIPLSGTTTSYNLQGMNPDTWYEIKVGAVFYNPQEVYLESETKLVNLSYTDVEDDALVPLARISNYPNPFLGNTTIEYEQKASGISELRIYNLKGQQVRLLDSSHKSPGSYQLQWDGRDDGGRACASGIYYLQVKNGKHTQTRKMLMLK